MSSILRSSKFVRYFAGLARNIVFSNRQDIDGSLIQRSQNLTGVISSHFSSSPSTYQAGSTLDNTIRRLDEDARRIGRISLKEVEDALREIQNLKNASTSQSLMVIRCCGNLVPEETPEHRTKLVDEIWNTLEKLGVSLDISHYNALLKVYLENEHKFSPTDFLAKLQRNGVEPNRVTFQRLIAGYCQLGDINGATKILEFMKEKQLPVSEGVFNALILGHSQADDMESAEGMIAVMKQANLEPSNETYCTLMSGYARRGDKEALDRLITDCKVKDILLSDRDILEVAYAAAVNGHDELVDEILQNIKNMLAYNQDAANVLLRLLTKGKDEAAYKIFLTMQGPVKPPQDSVNMSGHIIIKHYIKLNKPVEQILSMCKRLKEDGHTSHGLYIALETSFYQKNIDLTLALLREYKAENRPIRPHYFWPALVTLGNAKNYEGMTTLLSTMVTEFDCPPNSDTIREYYLHFVDMTNPDQTLKSLLECGISKRQCVVALVHHLLSKYKIKQAVSVALQNPVINLKTISTNRMLVDCLQNSADVKDVVDLVHIMVENRLFDTKERQDEEDENLPVEEISGRFLAGVANFINTKNLTVDVMKEMVRQGLGITPSCATLVEAKLQGSLLTAEASELLAKLGSGNLTPEPLERPINATRSAAPMNVMAMERLKEKLKAENNSQEKLIPITRSLFYQYCFKTDLQNALRIKQEWTEELKQELTPGLWACLMEAYCANGDLEGAKDCLKKVGGIEVNAVKLAKLAKLYIENNLFEDAISILKNTKVRQDSQSFLTRNTCFQTLHATAVTTKDPEKVKALLEVFVEKNYTEKSNINLGPIIKAYLDRDDLEGALKEFEHCVDNHRATPWKNELAIRLIEKEDPINLQRLVDMSTKVHGEINSLYDLVFSFVECGRIRQARKILETPGLRGKNNRINLACERYMSEGLAAPIEGLVEATKDLHFIDRSEIYYQLLNIYCKEDKADKALGLWTQMQDEDVNVSDEFLLKLGTFLKRRGLAVPFAIPKLVAKPKTEVRTVAKSTSTNSPSPMFLALKNNNLDEALDIKRKLDNNGGQLTKFEVSRLIELLTEKNRLQEATNLVISATNHTLPQVPVLKFLTTTLLKNSEYELFKKLDTHLPENTKKAISFINKYFACAVTTGKAKDELDSLEMAIDKASESEEIDELALKFPRGGIFAVLKSSPDYHEQVTRIVDKYDKKGIKSPANCLLLFYLGNGQLDKAKEIYDKYNIANSSRIMFQSIVRQAKATNSEQPIEDAISLMKDAPSLAPRGLAVMYSAMINICVNNNNAEKGLAKLEEALKTVSLEHINTNTLTSLKRELGKKNIPFKYTIPDSRKIEEATSSSSSSDAEPRQSVAAKH